MYAGYLNLGTATKRFYDIDILPMYGAFVPGYINDPECLFVGTLETSDEVKLRSDIDKLYLFPKSDCTVEVNWSVAEHDNIVISANFGIAGDGNSIIDPTAIELNASNDWQVIIPNKYLFDDKGNEIQYGVEVTAVAPEGACSTSVQVVDHRQFTIEAEATDATT